MNIQVEFKDENGEAQRTGCDNLHGGRPLAENVREALTLVPDGGYALAVYADGEKVL